MYYGAYKILIADVKCIMRPSFLPSLVSLGDQGDPAEQLLGILGEHKSETGEAGDNLFTYFSVLTPSHMHTDTHNQF